MRELKEIIESEIDSFDNIDGSTNDTEKVMSNHDIFSLDRLNSALDRLNDSKDSLMLHTVYNEFHKYIKEIKNYHINVDDPRFVVDFINYFLEGKFNTEVEMLYKKVINFFNQRELVRKELFNEFWKQYNFSKCTLPHQRTYRLKSELLYSMESQVNAFMNATEKNEQYKSSLEGQLLMRLIESMDNVKDKIEIITFGCGSGRQEMAFIEELVNYHSLEYSSVYLTDINQAMVDQALFYAESSRNKNSKNTELNIVGKTCNFIEFDQIQAIPYNHDKQKLFLFLGSTISNFRDEQAIIMDNIYKSMNIGDILIVGYRSIIHQDDYTTDTELMKSAYESQQTEDFVCKPLEILGITRKPSGVLGKLEIHLCNQPLQDGSLWGRPVRMRMSFNFERSYNLKMDDRSIPFIKGDSINIISSERFYPETASTTFYHRDLKCNLLPISERSLINDKEGYAVSLFEIKEHEYDKGTLMRKYCDNFRDMDGNRFVSKCK
ncbi:L-histidine N(alpha)-methyltransferase [Nanoarchaeota archaeon]